MAHNSLNRIIKQEKVDCELEGARQKLDGALQFLVDKAEESSSSSDESLKNLDIVVKQEDLEKLADVMTPLRRTIRRPGRKRKSRDDYSLKNSYILKLFDRSVDLAQFGAETPLYPVCRAWIRNKPRKGSPGPSNRRSRSPSPRVPDNEVTEDSQDDSSDVNRNIYQLPLPAPLPRKYLNKSPRIPSPLPKEKKELLVSSSNEAPAPENLLTEHIIRWRMVRQKWKDAASLNEERYKQSTNVLKTMFENAFPKDLPETNDQWAAQ